MAVDVRAIQVNDWVHWDGDVWVLQAFSGLTLHLRSRGTRGHLAASVSEVLNAPDFHVEKSDSADRLYGQRAAHPLDEFPKHAADAARALEADLNIMLTGYPTDPPEPGAHRCSVYDDMSAMQRYAHLGKQRGVTGRQVIRWIRRYEKNGVAGLVDERYLQLVKGVRNIDPVLRSEMIAVLEETKYSSKLTNNELRHRVTARMKDKFDENGEPLSVPQERTFNRYLASLTALTGRHLTQASQRNADNRPTEVVPWESVTRPMEWVMLDTTPLDAFAMNPLAEDKDNQWQRVFLTIAVDVFTRSIVGWVFTSDEPRAEDIALLLYRITSPKVAKPHWPDRARWRYAGAPDNLVFETAHEVELEVAGNPFGRVETFVVDHGKVYISEAIREAARILGSNLQLARIRTPTDKPHVEAAFRRIRQQFVMRLPGYKGPDIASRGSKDEVEGAAFLFLWEIEDAFAEWVACDYQNTVHEGLSFQSCPELELTPNEAYDYGISRSGLLPVPPSNRLLIDLLPTEWRTVQHYGIELAGIRYNGNILDDYRNKRSPWAGKGHRWKIKADRTDRSRIWFWAMDLTGDDTSIGTWEPLHYRGWEEAPLFSDEEIAYAKAVIIGRGGNTRNADEFEPILDNILRRIELAQDLPANERRMMARTYLRAITQAHDKEQRHNGQHNGLPQPQPHPSTQPPVTPPESLTDHWEPPIGPPEQPSALYAGPDEIVVDWFSDLEGSTDESEPPDDFDGTENLANEPQDPQ